MTQPRRNTPAGNPRVDRVREAMRDHDEHAEHDSEGTERNRERDDALKPEGPGEREQDEKSDDT